MNVTNKKLIYRGGIAIYFVGVVLFLSGIGAFSGVGVVNDASTSEDVSVIEAPADSQSFIQLPMSETVLPPSEEPTIPGESEGVLDGFLEIHSIVEWFQIFGGMGAMAIGVYFLRSIEIEAKRRRRELTNF
jgi:hypothetical protein